MISRSILLLSLVTTTALAQEAARVTASATAPEILASGSGQVRIRPDRATLTVSVVVRNASATEAGRLNAERMNSVLAVVRRLGVADSALATSGFSIGVEEPPYDAPAPPPDAPVVYLARNSVTMTLTDLGSLGRLVDSTLQAGASEVGGISYSSSQADEAHRRAIGLAVRDARADAEAAAEAAGGQLGPMIELSMVPAYLGRIAGAGLYGTNRLSSVSILAPSDVSETAAVTVRFAFVPRR